jgi:hypothetical protein
MNTLWLSMEVTVSVYDMSGGRTYIHPWAGIHLVDESPGSDPIEIMIMVRKIAR